MSIHHFHCTDGRDMILDPRGRRVEDEEVELCARLAAGRLMSRLPGYGEWSNWIVAVYDEDGRSVATVPFPDGPAPETRPTDRRARRLVAWAWRAHQDRGLRTG